LDWQVAIERNHAALRQVLAMLVAMAGLGGEVGLASPLWGGRRKAAGGGPIQTRTTTQGRAACLARPSDLHKEKVRTPSSAPGDIQRGETSPALTLHRRMYYSILRLLRPAEAAARRLVILVARSLVVPVLPPRREQRPASPFLAPPGATGIHLPPGVSLPGISPVPPARSVSLPLFDPMKRPLGPQPRHSCVPRILVPGVLTPFAVVPRMAPSPFDLLEITPLARRLNALGRLLDDLPRAARRLARWRARRDAALADGRRFRLSPLRPGPAPGAPRRPDHAVHDLLVELQGLARWALEPPDTS